MTGTNVKLTTTVETYFTDPGRVRASGGATGERSSYGPLANLLNAVGASLRPAVFCVGELADQGAGHPDFGLYAAKQLQKGRPREGQTPERGVIEVKAGAAERALRRRHDAIILKAMKRAGLWLIAALLLTAASASAGEVSDYDRFQLWNECRPMHLYVHILPDGATAIGLTEDATEDAVRSRLRAAGLYSEDHSETAGAILFVNVRVSGPAFSTALEYWKGCTRPHNRIAKPGDDLVFWCSGDARTKFERHRGCRVGGCR